MGFYTALGPCAAPRVPRPACERSPVRSPSLLPASARHLLELSSQLAISAALTFFPSISMLMFSIFNCTRHVEVLTPSNPVRSGPLQSNPIRPNSALSSLKSQGSSLKSQISRLKSQGSRLKSQISNLKSAQLSTLESQVSSLKAQISTLKSQISNLLNSQLSSPKAQGSRLKAQGSTLGSQASTSRVRSSPVHHEVQGGLDPGPSWTGPSRGPDRHGPWTGPSRGPGRAGGKGSKAVVAGWALTLS